MAVSVFDLFSVGIGPSSSHTVGPMRAAGMFVDELVGRDMVDHVAEVKVDLFGSLAATGAGHGTMPAILLGLEGYRPETIETDEMERRLATIRADGKIQLGGRIVIALTESDMDLQPARQLARHPNAMTLTAFSVGGDVVYRETYFSVGGGFVVTETGAARHETAGADTNGSFRSAAELLAVTERDGLSVSQAMMRQECLARSEAEVRERLLHIRDVMVACQANGVSRDGYLPGNLMVRRRAKDWFVRLDAEDPQRDPAFAEDWVNLVALAVNEENASGGRIVTAPTNGAAGIIPAVLHYALRYTPAGIADPDDTTVRFLLTAGAIGSLYKERASISGAEVGCQGEVGSAASMAAGGLAEILGGTPQQVENAAEIAMEHSLGLTCDPIGGLVQIPCIERNAISAGKAINAARMALRGDGTHRVSLDQVIETMRATGMDMSAKYKETSTGGLAVAVNVVEC
ncbi:MULTISPECIES: L-serine ammonia-lyase [unclassified Mycolicibacterium]|uniref:L-serine ammonia-lyase n=1 Tax=unclassified Mycolicibacterium TaxID=2636767 RepID=UPI0012DC5860|nr:MULTISPECIES: L-serine ammonia-lyase [unclassified Mycolicibacterium]MUL82032.1 L-serine ammonia-lyase [Mycolicibacterium sp. CBMA 329]MUL87798.1 L-serine ammonia-lyase [Mycolicibacterium sp. CBMA 331]MUM01622.1 L-serine ammonia-lyase [Mycolicibacterium sp. CBMA 334]MUM27254.1 L-serine ammonia-lyase [Mycolicibacterium sp. CBMA 295]MUM38095.1 L-serine ammonia-lyase [Mycolicibacterium sp. CBMA 247]